MAGRGRTPLTPQQVGTINEMASKGNSNGAIANSLSIKKSTVAYHASRARQPGGSSRPDNRGWPMALSNRELRGLCRLVLDSPFSSMAEIAEKVNNERTSDAGEPALSPVSAVTVRRAVKTLGLAACAPALKPSVSEVNKKKRLQWACVHKCWTDQWAFVLFSDESSFLVRKPQVRRVWRQPGERYSSVNLRPSFKSGRESVMVWGVFSSRGRTPLVRVEGSMNAASYSILLEDTVVHFFYVHFGSPEKGLFQEDLAPCHTAKAWKATKEALGMEVLLWVGQSPDMNTIENAWAELERRLRARPTAPKTKDELFNALQEEWSAIPDAYFKELVQSMPRRVAAVVAARGASTKY